MLLLFGSGRIGLTNPSAFLIGGAARNKSLFCLQDVGRLGDMPGMERPAESEIRFLEYRLSVIIDWPASPRKRAVAEAISRRLTAIGRASLCRPDIEHLLAESCRLLDTLFATNVTDAPCPASSR